jgi:ABC-type nickel/cobalt efflux system permease component RcnA
MHFLTDSITNGSAPILILTVAVVGVLHTIVPDHWVPIMLIARERKWTRVQTARAALTAGIGHVITTLILGVIVWIAGVAVATRFGHVIDVLSSIALIAFGLWIAISSWREMYLHRGHSHSHDFSHLEDGEENGVHGPELERIETANGVIDFSIYENNMPPHFRISDTDLSPIGYTVKVVRPDSSEEQYALENKGAYWQSLKIIPEPHEFSAQVIVTFNGLSRSYPVEFEEHSHNHGHNTTSSSKKNRNALLLIMGSSPMIEGIPAFFAAGKYGIGIISVMAVVFALATICTYVILCVYSAAGLNKMQWRAFEKYGEVISGSFIVLIGLVFWIFPVF